MLLKSQEYTYTLLFKPGNVIGVADTLPRAPIGLCVHPAKLTDISDKQPPTNIGELRRFMGMANYVARFLPHLTDTMQPLQYLLKKDVPYVWSQTMQTSVKLMLIHALVLALYNRSKELVLEKDASEYRLGSFLM